MSKKLTAVERQKARRESPEMTKLLIHEVPVNLKRQFKEQCVRMGKTMRGEILSFLRQYTSKKKKRT